MLYKVRRKLLSQNFLYSRTLINSLVRRSSIGSNDVVLEIGPGKGFITEELLRVAKRVVAIELDQKLIFHLKKFLGTHPKFDLFEGDFLKFNLPQFPFKVFANIPFSIEGEIIRKLLDSNNPPEDCYLVVDKRLAERLSGNQGMNQFYLKHAPWFDFSIEYYFKKSDFIPIPNVDSVLLRITKKSEALLNWNKRDDWERFIEIGFGQGRPVNQNLIGILNKEQLNCLVSKLNFSIRLKPGNLALNQWLQIYASI